MTDQTATAATERRSTSPDRDLSFDFAKGILIILVMIGHLLQYIMYRDNQYWYSPYFKSIYMFHMPLFMGISGYLSSGALLRKTFTRGVQERAIQLLLPVLFWSTLMEAVKLAVFSPALPSGLLGFPSELAGAYWFVWANFASFLLVGLLSAAGLGSTRIISISAVLVAFAPVTFSIAPLIRYTYPFFCLGLLLARSDWRTSALLRHRLILFFLLSGLALVCFLAWGMETYVYNNLVLVYDVQSARQVLLMFIGSAAASAVAFEVVLRCWQFSHSSRIARFIAVELGQSTLVLYLIQASLFRLMDLVHFRELWNFPARIAAAIALGVTIVVIGISVRRSVSGFGFMSRLVLGAKPRSTLPNTQFAVPNCGESYTAQPTKR
ncbi:nodulation factor fucose acetyltransferase NolL [Bradyrhizobium stylosanthis]|uniref:nodulation factor fucose acetyltransferase NolL n=1 Tax=Bradyrhizobium stylosanthis TaxID=1803665 RepID=UPI0007C56C1D|nr:nodulation factor fucose acetyltransferase NolL [Bradyrhizobium stylosanthis]